LKNKKYASPASPSDPSSSTFYGQLNVMVDVVLLTLKEDILHVALHRRKEEPFQDTLALPGGYVHVNEDQDVTDTAKRIFHNKCGIAPTYIEQLFTFSGSARDPRGWSVSIAFYGLALLEDLTAQGSELVLVPADQPKSLPFDHNQILDLAIRRLRQKSSYSSLPLYLLPKEFSLTEMQAVYEQVIGHSLDRLSFRRKVEALGFIEPVAGAFREGAHRPAQLYRSASNRLQAFESTFS
jgi:8-oxo-dGTP diphosphatase